MNTDQIAAKIAERQSETDAERQAEGRAEERLVALESQVQELTERAYRGEAWIATTLNAVAERVEALEAKHMVVLAAFQEQSLQVQELTDRLNAMQPRMDEMVIKVDSRNKSAPMRRNMTDADATAVLDGDLASLGHKEAADVRGLTYAQVYSCRLGYTFKHVHKELERAGRPTDRWARA